MWAGVISVTSRNDFIRDQHPYCLMSGELKGLAELMNHTDIHITKQTVLVFALKSGTL